MAISWLGFLAKLIPHADKLDDLAEAAGAFLDAEGLVDHWEATKRFGDLLVPILASVTGFDVSSEESAVEAMKLGDGSVLKRIRDAIESPAGQLLIGFLLKKYLGG